MPQNLRRYVLSAAILCVGAALLPIGAEACCALSRGEPVIFGGQRNIVIWDEKAGVEHFIREAGFKSDADRFGFIAPTPSVPQLAAAKSEAFDQLAALAPKPPPSLSCSSQDAAVGSRAAGSVEVVQEVDVAGYHAKTLKAEDASGLAAYLKENGFASSPDFEKWLDHYIAKGWYLTSFQVKTGSSAAQTSPVRMTFRTDKPFNPYYVPLNNQAEDKAEPVGNDGLKVYLISADKLAPSLGDAPPPAAWRSPVWTAQLQPHHIGQLSSTLELPLANFSAGAKLAYYTDYGFARHGESEDIFFEQANQSSEVIKSVLVASSITVLVLAAAWAMTMRKRSRSGPHPSNP